MLKAATTFLHNNACSDGVNPVKIYKGIERTCMMNLSLIPSPIKSQEILFKMKIHLTRVPFDQNVD